LLQAGSSYVFGEDSIRYSFLTYQYGTMFFGEFDYSYFLQRSQPLQFVMQAVLFLGLLYLLGFLIFIWNLNKVSRLQLLLFTTFLLNFLLILKFIFTYPAICNTDFRYFVTSFPLIAWFMAHGLFLLKKGEVVKKAINLWLLFLFLSEILYFVLLFFT
jgi:hypothetical protein